MAELSAEQFEMYLTIAVEYGIISKAEASYRRLSLKEDSDVSRAIILSDIQDLIDARMRS